MISNIVKLKTVNKTDYEFLYDLLKNRNPRANISHKKLPSFAKHIKFIESRPYSKWYIILRRILSFIVIIILICSYLIITKM